MNTTYIKRCPSCGTPCYEPNGQCPLCNCVFIPVSQDVKLLLDLDCGFTGAERADALMERAKKEIERLYEMTIKLRNENLDLALKNAELLGSLQAYRILDADGRVNRG